MFGSDIIRIKVKGYLRNITDNEIFEFEERGIKNKDKITMFNKEIVLRVGAAAGTYSIKDSMLKYKDVYFCFCTNSPAYTADTNVGYNPR